MSDDDVVKFVRTQYPKAQLVTLSPRLAHAEASLLQRQFVLTPYSTTLQVGQAHNAEVSLDRDALSFLLSGRTTDLPLGRVSMIFTVRGYELDLEGKRSVADRRLVITGYIDGGCARAEHKYVNASTGHVGCVLPIKYEATEVFEVQKALQIAGYYRATPDGVFGNSTRNAVKRAQKQLNLIASGRLDYATYKAISSGKLGNLPGEQPPSGGPTSKHYRAIDKIARPQAHFKARPKADPVSPPRKVSKELADQGKID
jgi:hypothetical protein